MSEELIKEFCREYAGKLTRNGRIWWYQTNGRWFKDARGVIVEGLIMRHWLETHNLDYYKHIAELQTRAARLLKYSAEVGQ